MLKCLIIDDELLAIDVIAEYIPRVPFLELSGTYSNPIDALMHLKKEEVDLIFLDIQMPQISGLQFMSLLKTKVQVIIVSAYNEFALQGYEHDVTDYLLKPVSFDRFLKAVEKARRLWELTTAGTPAVVAPSEDFIFVKSGNKIVKINLDDILFIEGLRNYITIHTTGNKRIVTLQSMKTLEELLPSRRFVRVQKSFIVQLSKIDSIERQRIFVGSHVIPIGETFATGFFALIGNASKG